MKKLYIIALIFSCSTTYSLADEASGAHYEQVLKRHQREGHISKEDYNHQKLQYEKGKAWQKNFDQQVRGVASKLSNPREIITLKNRPIEISVK